ncbi:hypothetical protein [Flavihumibacter petaseus]|uniref:Uncharacterized protein n=1 Tax=Flavihumibacter petaseus NBRC 106054 TaxID=1220578 RepID=A0A0E9N5L3_9BACT|nr:hypothetical protein [Flavihumibacter petaseus]GAO44971.1 hypothetical protein FPE01S_04_02140 [Flavihumibacter petaseus NBRC 106054]
MENKKPRRDLSYINSVHDLQAEEALLRARIRAQEDELKVHLRSLPKEAFKAGVGSVVQPILSNKAASVALTAGSALLGNFFVKKAATTVSHAAFSSIKKAGLLALGNVTLKWLFGKKKK